MFAGCAFTFSGEGDLESSYTMEDFDRVQKIDMHTHILSDNSDFVYAREPFFPAMNEERWIHGYLMTGEADL